MSVKTLLPLAKIAISLWLVYFALSHVALESALARLLGVDLVWLAAAVAVAVLSLYLAAVRWLVVQKAIGAPLGHGDAMKLFYVGMFFNQTLPSSVGGDPVRMYMARQAGLPASKAVTGVFLDRLISCIGLLAVVNLAAPAFLAMVPPNVEAPFGSMAPLAESAAPVLWTVNLAALAGVALLISFDSLPPSLRELVLFRGLGHLGADTRALLKRPLLTLLAILLGALNTVLLSLMGYVIVKGLGVDAPFVDFLVLIPPVMLATLIPITVGGWGIRETAMMTAFAVINLPGEVSVSMSLLIGVIFLIACLPGGLLWLRSDSRRLAQSKALAGGPRAFGSGR